MGARTRDLSWFAVRTIFRHAVRGEVASYEEKITMYRARDASDAIERAKRDAQAYLKMNPVFVQLKHYDVFSLSQAEGDLDASEVWSHLNEGPVDPEEFFRQKYERFTLEK